VKGVISAPLRADKIGTLILRTLFTKKDARVEQKSSECSVEELMVSLLCSYKCNDTSKTAKIMNGDITLAALCHCQRASKVISPFIIFAVFDVLFRRYNLYINHRFFLHLYLLFHYRGVCIQYRLPVYHNV